MTSYEMPATADTGLRHVFDLDGPVRVDVDNPSGEIRVEAGESGRARVEADSDGGREGLDKVQVGLDHGVLRVVVPRGQRRWFGSGRGVVLRIVVPAGSAVTAQTESGELTLVGSLGDADLRAASGEVSVDEVTGLRVRSASGDVRVSRVIGECRVATASGDVEIRDVGGRAQAETASGGIELGRVGGEVEVSTASGDVEVADAGGDLRARTLSGDVRLRRVGGSRVQVTGASGDVEIGVPEGVAAWLDLTSAAGDVDSELPDTGEPEPGTPVVEVRAVTASGDIRIHRA